MDGIFLDIETTGLDAKIHQPIDVALKIVDLSTHEIKATFQSLIRLPLEVWDKHDPISMQINGYLFEDIQEGLALEDVGKLIVELFQKIKITRGKAVYICQNPSFDRAFFNQLIPVYTQEKLNWPYHWLDFASMYWVKVVEEGSQLPETMSLSKNSIAESLGLDKEDLPHRAINGVDHLLKCYLKLLYSKE